MSSFPLIIVPASASSELSMTPASVPTANASVHRKCFSGRQTQTSRLLLGATMQDVRRLQRLCLIETGSTTSSGQANPRSDRHLSGTRRFGWLGKANQLYGELLRSPAVTRLERIYRSGQGGFLDKSVTFDNRLAKASEYLSASLAFYEQAQLKAQETSDYHQLALTYYEMAWSYHLLGEKIPACTSYDRSLETYKTFLQRNPTVTAATNPDAASAAKTIASVKSRLACP